MIDFNLDIFSKFKETTLSVDHYLSAQSGAGQNFLSGKLLKNFVYPENYAIENKLGWVKHNKKNHEYQLCNLGRYTDWNSLDHLTCSQFYFKTSIDKVIVNIDDIVNNATSIYTRNKLSNSINLLRGHELPYIFSNVFNAQFNEITSIETTNETFWIPAILAFIKNELYLETEIWKFDKILAAYFDEINNSMKTVGNISHMGVNIQTLSEMLSESGFIDLNMRSIISTRCFINYKFIFKCLGNKTSPTKYLYKKFITEYINKILFYPNTIEFSIHNNYLISYFKSKSTIFNKIEYTSLFFDLELPESKRWSVINKSDIAEYSYNNLTMIRKLAEMIEYCPEQEFILSNIALFEKRLTLASQKL